MPTRKKGRREKVQGKVRDKQKQEKKNPETASRLGQAKKKDKREGTGKK